MVEDAIEWFMGKYDFDDECNFTVNLKTYESMDCYGETQQFKKNKYEINLATDQGLRDFLATLMHELVHVHQWEREEWEGDGEEGKVHGYVCVGECVCVHGCMLVISI